jgi:hypothetical protein
MGCPVPATGGARLQGTRIDARRVGRPLHRVRLAAARLAVGEDAGVVAVGARPHERQHLGEHALLAGAGPEHRIELKLARLAPRLVQRDQALEREAHGAARARERRGPDTGEDADVAAQGLRGG